VETAKMIRRMYLTKISQETKLKTLRMDALIARLAVKNDGFVVTVDVDDFELIKKVLPDLQIISASKFFGE
jgi:predicted nucleic acid-binding protein